MSAPVQERSSPSCTTEASAILVEKVEPSVYSLRGARRGLQAVPLTGCRALLRHQYLKQPGVSI